MSNNEHRPGTAMRLARLVIPVLFILSTALIATRVSSPASAQTTSPVTFSHPVTISVGQEGFEPDLRTDYKNVLYSSVPNGFATSISFMWRSEDYGASWRLVPDSSGDGTGKLLTTCVGGGDTEMVIDQANRLYFNDLQGLTNFSTSKTTDGGTTFQSSCAGTPTNTLVDRQWYAVDGDPYSGNGHVFLAYDQVAQSTDIGCGVGNNQLVMTESPPPGTPASGAPTAAGLEFGPQNKASCQEGIMGNDEVSPNVDPKYHRHYVFDIHDNGTFNSVYMLRCVQVPVTVNLSGLQCADHLVYHQANVNVGQDFATMAVDQSGNLYAVWAQTPLTSTGAFRGETDIYMSSSTDNGNTWSTPHRVNNPCGAPCDVNSQSATNVFPWVVAGTDGRIDIAYYGTKTYTNPSGQYGADTLTNADWNVYMSQSLNATSSSPTFGVTKVSEKPIHYGSIQTLPNQTGDRTSGDFLNVRMGTSGAAIITYVDSANNTDLGQNFFANQNGGPSLLSYHSTVDSYGPGYNNAAPDGDCQTTDTSDSDYVADSHDAAYDANAMSTPLCGTNVDLQSSAMAVDPNNANMLRITLSVANLKSLAPPTSSGDTDTTIDWLTAWHQPCTHNATTCATDGHVYFAYMESVNGGAPTMYYGSSKSVCCAFTTYPGTNLIASTVPTCATSTASDCYVPGSPGRIVIDVPRSGVGNPANGSTLYSITSSAITLPAPGNSNNGICTTANGNNCGVLFNLIDSNNVYDATVEPRTSQLLAPLP